MPINRRRFLVLSTVASLAPSAVVANTRREYMVQLNGYAVNAETPLELLTDYLTPNRLFFVRSHWLPHPPDQHKWTLSVDGDVATAMQLTLADLRGMPVTEVTCVLQCAGNGRGLYAPTVPGVQWRYGALGNARWRGARVRDVLDRAGLKSSAKHLHTFGSDDPPKSVPPFHRSIELEKALDDSILAWEMNGEPLATARRSSTPGSPRADMIAYLTKHFGPDNNRFKPLHTRPVGY